MGLLDGSLAKTVYDAMKNVFLDGQLIQEDRGTYNEETGSFAGGTGESAYDIKVLREHWSAYRQAQGIVAKQDRKFIILAESCTVEPALGDILLYDGTRYTIAEPMERDPANAVYIVNGKL